MIKLRNASDDVCGSVFIHGGESAFEKSVSIFAFGGEHFSIFF